MNIEVQSGSMAQRREEAKALSKSLRDCEKEKKKKKIEKEKKRRLSLRVREACEGKFKRI